MRGSGALTKMLLVLALGVGLVVSGCAGPDKPTDGEGPVLKPPEPTPEVVEQMVELTQDPGVFIQKSMMLKPGYYRFEVSNKSVGHEVGFLLERVLAPDVEPEQLALFGGIFPGERKSSDVVYMEPGVYYFSCPLNPTPKYRLIVKQEEAAPMEPSMEEPAPAEPTDMDEPAPEEPMDEGMGEGEPPVDEVPVDEPPVEDLPAPSEE